ncbi:MAG: VOC family protein [Saprospiraceae bacterium]|nr:VOC family protein [Saprospiraceae bacterium]
MAIKANGLHHFALAVSQLEKSLTFYHDILGLSILSRPDFDFDGAWLYCGNDISLHLIVNENIQVALSDSRQLHFAFSVNDVYQTKKQLMSKGVEIVKDIQSRPDGVLQLFIKDPDGYFIELTEG